MYIVYFLLYTIYLLAGDAQRSPGLYYYPDIVTLAVYPRLELFHDFS